MKIYDYDVKYYSSVDAVVITDRYWRTYNCNKEDDVRIILNILCGRINNLQRRNKQLEGRLERIEDIIDEKYCGD